MTSTAGIRYATAYGWLLPSTTSVSGYDYESQRFSMKETGLKAWLDRAFSRLY
jgi:hypothetical protein